MKVRITLRNLTIALLLAAGATAADAAPRGLEPVKTERAEAKTVVKESEIEIRTMRGLIILSVSRASQIKVVTILGRTICNDTVGAGTYELHLAHGVYIVKVGELTFKVAV